MRTWGKVLLLCCVAAAGVPVTRAADEKEAKFAVQPAASYSSKLAIGGVTIAAVPYTTSEQARTAFGKVDPNEHGVLPVLVVIQNDSRQVVRLEQMQVEYVTAQRNRLEAIHPRDLPYLKGPKRPDMRPRPPIPTFGRGKNPLADRILEARAFAAKMLPPGESAHGFYYFQTGPRENSILYVTGLAEAATGKELFFFEISLP